jgi:hypothetical protein
LESGGRLADRAKTHFREWICRRHDLLLGAHADKPGAAAGGHGSIGEAATFTANDLTLGVGFFDHEKLGVESVDEAARKQGELL